jgi:hypothetical protein
MCHDVPKNMLVFFGFFTDLMLRRACQLIRENAVLETDRLLLLPISKLFPAFSRIN